MSHHDADLIGIGFGPGNLALAIALKERHPHLKAVFLESRPGPAWQPGMLLDGSDIQNNPIRDLISPVNPRSRFTFINYLHETGRFFAYLNLGAQYPLRKEYAGYVRWVAEQVGADVRYDARVTEVLRDGRNPATAVVRLADGSELRAPAVVAAPGRAPNVPEPFTSIAHPRVRHFTEYLDALSEVAGHREPRVVVVGGSQSAVELVLDLRSQLPHGQVTGLVRSFGYRQKDTSPFMDEVYLPEFTDYYYEASEDAKKALNRDLRYTNYSAADIDVIHTLYLKMHEDRLDGAERVDVRRCTDIEGCAADGERVTLSLRERYTGDTEELQADLVVLATGFRDLGSPKEGGEFLPALLNGIAAGVRATASGRADVGRDYRLPAADPDAPFPLVYLNGLCETSHGMGDAGSFSLLALRARDIASSLHSHLTGPDCRAPGAGTANTTAA
ncbi:SidA/IucD/PvdA family monooxygenase [Streptomyces sp. NPDC048606]|uniref:lysine N(6)-hydroxylase/L-ornithine N(5)-oxygenase family protein n=1 Tax=Streptomyces sp. NPDC048606 TaxID=3154726 RepID=UPI00343C2088